MAMGQKATKSIFQGIKVSLKCIPGRHLSALSVFGLVRLLFFFGNDELF